MIDQIEDDSIYFLPVIIPKKNQYSFQSIFNYLKRTLHIKAARKSNIDSLLKKAKARFFKAIHDSLKLCLNLIIKRLPQKFITNITIEYNQRLLSKSMFSIYEEYNILPSKAEIREKDLYRNNKRDVYNDLIESSFDELYEIYLQSKRFEADLKKINQREGKKTLILYKFVAKNFIKYYRFNKAHFQKPKKKIFLVHKTHKITSRNLFD